MNFGSCDKKAAIHINESRICFVQTQPCGAWDVTLFTFTLRAAQSGRKNGVHVNMTLATEVYLPAYDHRSFEETTLHFKSLRVMPRTSATVSGFTWTFKCALNLLLSKEDVTENIPEVQVIFWTRSALGSESGNPEAVQRYTTTAK